MHKASDGSSRGEAIGSRPGMLPAGTLKVCPRIEATACAYGALIHNPDPRGIFEVTEDERKAFWERRYSGPGSAISTANFRDVLTDPKANAALSDFLARKIPSRSRIPK